MSPLARQIGGVLAGASVVLVFAVWFYRDLTAWIPADAPAPTAPDPLVEAAEQRRDQASALLSAFAEAVAVRDYSRALALMAAPYRAAHDAASLERACAANALCAGATDIVVLSTREQHVQGGAAGRPESFVARGVLRSDAGTAELTAHLAFGLGGPAIVSLVIDGVPVLMTSGPPPEEPRDGSGRVGGSPP